MFTGIVTDVGQVVGRTLTHEGGTFSIASRFEAGGIALGASIACAGCCLTVTRVVPASTGGAVFDVDISNETLSRTTLGGWREGTRINLERSLTLGTELGGHIVTGHVDGLAEILARREDGNSERFSFACSDELARYVATKGSVTLDGTSLTVNEVAGTTFGVNLIPHTLSVTTWGERRVGDRVNLEVDLLARYVARILGREETR
ncbi:MAG: riboflavin synthase [Rhizobiales bacterium]|nr:riboflavin synthase [Hyphomicrobiales bacterium]